ncbi:hypothetical protein Bbelb_318630 [Branchiostoma belcheri]|nr:hypothetical protein Bbelb_318630 [Branchiostoma belcheri]
MRHQIRFQKRRIGLVQLSIVWLSKEVGTYMQVVFTKCKGCSYRGTWRSQPFFGRTAAGNMLLSSAILFGGASVTGGAGPVTHGHQEQVLSKTVQKLWKERQFWMLTVLQAEGENPSCVVVMFEQTPLDTTVWTLRQIWDKHTDGSEEDSCHRHPTLHFITFKASEDSLRELLQSDDGLDMVTMAGWRNPSRQTSLDDLPLLKRALCLQLQGLVISRKSAIEQLKEGLKLLGLGDAPEAEPQLIAALLCKSTEVVSADSIAELLVVKWAPEGSNHKEKQKDVFENLTSWLDVVEEGLARVSLDDFLQFFTALEARPPTGWPMEPMLHFVHCDDGCRCLPEANTGSFSLYLPEHMATLSKFEFYTTMEEAIISGSQNVRAPAKESRRSPLRLDALFPAEPPPTVPWFQRTQLPTNYTTNRKSFSVGCVHLEGLTLQIVLRNSWRPNARRWSQSTADWQKTTVQGVTEKAANSGTSYKDFWMLTLDGEKLCPKHLSAQYTPGDERVSSRKKKKRRGDSVSALAKLSSNAALMQEVYQQR